MRKRRFFTLFTTIVLVFGMCMVLSSCKFDEENHTHDWETEWTSDGINHWHKCKGCDEIKDNANHSYVDGECICGKKESTGEQENPVVPLLSYSLSEDESYAICNGFSEGKESSDISIESEYDGKPVKAIAAKAFYNKSNLKNVVIADSVEKIGEYAFYNSGVTNIKLPNNLKTIEKATFTKSQLTKVDVPSSVTAIKEQAFWSCKDLQSVKIGNNVLEIGTYAFYECENLNSINIPNTVNTIGNYAFSRTAIESATVSSNVTAVGKGVFYQASMLKSVEINSKVVGETMFRECYALEDVTIGNNTTEIGASAFYNCKSLYEMTLSNNIKKVGSNAFYICYALTLYCEGEELIPGLSTVGSNYSVVLDCKNNKQDSKLNEYFVVDDIKYSVNMKKTSGQLVEDFARIIKGQRGRATELEIPDTVNYDGKNYPVKIIEKNAFSGKENIQKLSIGNNVETIDEYAFSSCHGIENIVFGNKVRTIGKNAFSGCTSITKLQLPDSVVNINDNAFGNCTGITRIFIPKNVYSMFSGTFHPFRGCIAVDSIEVDSDNADYKSENNCLLKKDGTRLYVACKNSGQIPQSVTTICKYAFSGIDTLTAVVIPEGVRLIENGAFRDCVSLAQVNIPSSVTSIYDEAFANTGLVDFVIPNNVTNLGKNMFLECSKLKNVTLPSAFRIFYSTWFVNCPQLESIRIGGEHEDFMSAGNNLLSKDGTALVFGVKDSQVPSSVTVIASNAYAGRGIESIVIPNGVQEFESQAFWQCKNLTTINIPKSLTKIGSSTFKACEKLATINFDGTMEEWKSIIKGSDWDYKTGEYSVNCSNGKLDKNGNTILN